MKNRHAHGPAVQPLEVQGFAQAYKCSAACPQTVETMDASHSEHIQLNHPDVDHIEEDCL